MSSRRLARKAAVDPAVPVSEDPKRITQQRLIHPGHGEVRTWSRGGEVYRMKLPGGRSVSRHSRPVEFKQLLEGLRP